MKQKNVSLSICQWIYLTCSTYKCNAPFKFCQNVSYQNSAFHSFVNGVIVFKECEHVPAVLHSQTSDQFLHYLNTEHEQPCYWVKFRMNLASKRATQTNLPSCGV